MKPEFMRTENPPAVRLEDYRPPDWLVETVNLDVSLHPHRTRVRAKLKLKPNPAGTAPAPVVLDGDIQKHLGEAEPDPQSPICRLWHVGGGVFRRRFVMPYAAELTVRVCVGGTRTEVYRAGGITHGADYRLKVRRPAAEVIFTYDHAARRLLSESADADLVG